VPQTDRLLGPGPNKLIKSKSELDKVCDSVTTQKRPGLETSPP